MKHFYKENKAEMIIFSTLIIFLIVNGIDKITKLQLAGFFLVIVAVLLRCIILNKPPKQGESVQNYNSIEKS